MLSDQCLLDSTVRSSNQDSNGLHKKKQESELYYHHFAHLPGLGILGLSYSNPLLPSYTPAGLSCPTICAPSLDSSSSNNAPGSWGSNIDCREPGVRNGESCEYPELGAGNTSFLGVTGKRLCAGFRVEGRLREGVRMFSEFVRLAGTQVSAPDAGKDDEAAGGGSRCDL
jgi:hypothetical protein